MSLSPLEQQSQDAIILAIEAMTNQKLAKVSYYDTLERLRLTLKALINKEFGCETGKHSGLCHCKGEK